MPINIVWVSYLLDVSFAKGNPVGELHMSQATRDDFVALLQSRGQKPPAVRWRGEVRMEQPWRFRNIPIVVNQRIPDGGMLIRPQATMEDPDWMEKALAKLRETAEGIASEPQSAQDAPAASDGEIYSSEVIQPQGDTVSDVLMASMTGCDDVESVIVILAKRGQVEVRCSVERFAAIGLLQAALGRVAQGD